MSHCDNRHTNDPCNGEVIAVSTNGLMHACIDHLALPMPLELAMLEPVRRRSSDDFMMHMVVETLWRIRLNERANMTNNDAEDWMRRCTNQFRPLALAESLAL